MTRLALIAALLAACGSDAVDLTGVYRVDSDVASMPCGTDAPVMTPPVALKFAKSNFFGTDYFSYSECDDIAGTMCNGGGLFDNSFSEPVDGGWRGVVTSSGGGGTTCTISYAEQTATLSGIQLVIEVKRYSEDVDNTPALCSTDEAQRRNTSMPCAAHERIDATKE